MTKVSVIMAVLNGMPYFPEALESVQNQTLQELEILVVDAGSTDGTLDYVAKKQAQDSRIKLLLSPMKSMGKQCNMALEVATGEYIGFCESDDYLEPNMLEDLYRIGTEKPEADGVIGKFFMLFGQGEQEENYIQSVISGGHKYHKLVKYEELPELQYGLVYMWHGIYPKHFLDTNRIRLNETAGASFQDVGFVEHVKFKANYFYFTDKPYYHYRRDNLGSSFYKRNVGLFEAQELEYAMETYLSDETTSQTVKFSIFERLFFIFDYHYRLDRLFCEAIDYEDKLIQLRVKMIDFYANFPFSAKLASENEELRLFLQDYHLYRAVIDKKNQEKKKVFAELFALIEKESKVVIFGCGEAGRSYRILLERKFPELQIIYCDNNEDLRVNAVLSPDEVAKKEKNLFYLQTVETAFKPMRNQIMACGVKAERILRLPNISLQEATTF